MSDGQDLPVDAHVSGQGRVTYIYRDGRTRTLHGNHPYRDNNPGNLNYPGRDGLARARSAGALAVDPTGPNKFAVFATPEGGEGALSGMIANRQAEGLTVAAFMSRYAPKGQNNLTAYLAAVAKATGAKPTDLLSSLAPSQIDILKETIRVHEGWRSPVRELSPPVDATVRPGVR